MRHCAFCFVIGASGWLAHETAAQATFQGLGQLSGGYASYAFGVSADGTTVVGKAYHDVAEAFRWKAGQGMQGLGDLAGGGFSSQAYGASADGAVVVGSGMAAEGMTAFRWTTGGGMQSLGHLSSVNPLSEARGTSADGAVVVGFAEGQAFRWTVTDGGAGGGGMIGLGYIPPQTSGGSQAYGVSADGSVIVGYSIRPLTSGDAFRWTPGSGMVGLGAGTANCRAYAEDVSADGHAAVGSITCWYDCEWCEHVYIFTYPFRWTAESGVTYIGSASNPTDYDEYAQGISADGQVAVGRSEYYDASSGTWFYSALIWDPANGMRDLGYLLVTQYGLGSQLAGWILEDATGISDDGRVIVGWGTNPSGQTEAFRVVLGSLPCSFFVAPDLDRDCDVDTDEVNAFRTCSSRAGVLPPPQCSSADFDQDGDVDMNDFTRLQRCYRGAELAPDPSCAQ